MWSLMTRDTGVGGRGAIWGKSRLTTGISYLPTHWSTISADNYSSSWSFTTVIEGRVACISALNVVLSGDLAYLVISAVNAPGFWLIMASLLKLFGDLGIGSRDFELIVSKFQLRVSSKLKQMTSLYSFLGRWIPRPLESFDLFTRNEKMENVQYQKECHCCSSCSKACALIEIPSVRQLRLSPLCESIM